MRPSISPLLFAAPFLAAPAMAETDSAALRRSVTMCTLAVMPGSSARSGFSTPTTML